MVHSGSQSPNSEDRGTHFTKFTHTKVSRQFHTIPYNRFFLVVNISFIDIRRRIPDNFTDS